MSECASSEPDVLPSSFLTSTDAGVPVADCSAAVPSACSVTATGSPSAAGAASLVEAGTTSVAAGASSVDGAEASSACSNSIPMSTEGKGAAAA